MATTPNDIGDVLSGDIVNLLVGPGPRWWPVRRALLDEHNLFQDSIYSIVKNEATGAFEERLVDDVYLDEDPALFELLIDWLHRGTLKVILFDEEEVVKAAVENYVRLYLRAEVWGLPNLQNIVLDRLRWRQPRDGAGSMNPYTNLIFQNLPKGSPLRTYAVESSLFEDRHNSHDNLATDSRERQLRSDVESGNLDFVIEKYGTLLKRCGQSDWVNPSEMTGCVFHKHEAGQSCQTRGNSQVFRSAGT